MTSAQWDSIIAAAVLVLVCVTQRRQIFSLSSIGFFFLANLVFGFIGVLLLPWVLTGAILSEDFKIGYGFLDWSEITDQDLSQTILLYIGGFLLVLIGHRVAMALRSSSESPSVAPEREIDIGRLVALTPGFLLYVIIHVATNPDIFIEGLTKQILSDYKDDLLIYRTAGTSDYIFVLVIYNVLPFLSTALWLRVRRGPTLPTVVFTIASILITAFALLLTFQTLALMVFAIAIACAEVAAARSRGPTGELSSRGRQLTRAVLILPGLLYLVSLLLRTMRSGEGASSAAIEPFMVILGRISVGAPLFVHYFPVLEPHYGLTNIGMVAALLGEPVYGPAIMVSRYFTHQYEGSMAVATLIDFYTAFGWVGWAVGALGLGGALALLDRAIAHIAPGECRTLALVFAFMFCVNTAEASITGALFGYGGLFFLVLWFVVSRKKTPALVQGAQLASPGAGVGLGAR